MKTSSEQRAERRLAGWVGLAIGSGLIFAFACAERSHLLDGAPFRRTAPIDGAGPALGAAICRECHGHQSAPAYHLDCEGCHGSGRLHVQNVLDPAHIRFPDNGTCLDCHATGRRGLLDWETSAHHGAGMLCADCHDPHNQEPRHLRPATIQARTLLPDASPSTQLCVDCHRDVTAKLGLPSHHPVREGMLDCGDCHAPHTSARAHAGLETERCTGCHQAQAGPWVFEHAPVAEDCGHCHTPHGAAADHLLIANQPGACVYCHTVAEMGAVHDPQAFVTRCTDCHNAIHGSFADPHLRR